MAFPDVCKTPAPPSPSPIPIPYPNIAMLNQATKTAKKVFFVNKSVVNLASEIPRSQGDEAGTNGGTISGTNMDKVQFKKGSSKVIVEAQARGGEEGAGASRPGFPTSRSWSPSSTRSRILSRS